MNTVKILEHNKAAGTVVIRNHVGDYLRLRGKGYTTVWTGNGRICLRKPAKARG